MSDKTFYAAAYDESVRIDNNLTLHLQGMESMHYWMIIELVIITVGIFVGGSVAIISCCAKYCRCSGGIGGMIKDFYKLTVDTAKENLPELKPFIKYYLILN